ncbi:hypothetical protein NEOLEDRAFT_886896 [Neolentinus lepideus HHB14362 ss-1]|uniref:Uncharacterized protein n=1 Tax=Neolentinus lepideus HHB14362 ss-1 TaxID=1314782 RepID=A0A165NWV0_9AGAM|nr:hypothetical protein NEOLEDRAFT_886896 [Neolentinus lepideus HHB14362 ss-1]
MAYCDEAPNLMMVGRCLPQALGAHVCWVTPGVCLLTGCPYLRALLVAQSFVGYGCIKVCASIRLVHKGRASAAEPATLGF